MAEKSGYTRQPEAVAMNPEFNPQNKPPRDETPLVFKFDYDPFELRLSQPTVEELEVWLTTSLAVLISRDLVVHLMDCARNQTPIDVGSLTEASDTSNVLIEERRWLSCNDSEVAEDRDIVISRPAKDSSDVNEKPEGDIAVAEESSAPSREPLVLELISPKVGRLDAVLTFKNEDLSTSLNDVNRRWEIFEELIFKQGSPPPLYDLGENVRADDFNPQEPVFICGQVDIAAHPVPSQVSNTYYDPDEAGVSDDGDDDKNDGLLESPQQGSDSAQRHQEKKMPAPGEPLAISDTSAETISRIATLSGCTLPLEHCKEILDQARGTATLGTNFMSRLPRDIKERLSVHTRTCHVLDGDYACSAYIQIEYSSRRDDIAFSISLRPTTFNSEGVATRVEASFDWCTTNETATKNWAQILKSAGYQGQR
jgi:hypothetical protein